jgi:hypothetical protein
MEANEFLAFAGRTVALGKAGARSAISRAYYGAFHLSRELLEDLVAETSRNARSHNLVPQFLSAANHVAATNAARALINLHTQRIIADYDLLNETVESLETAKLRVELAMDVARLLEEFRRDCLADPQLLQNLRNGVARVKSIHQA